MQRKLIIAGLAILFSQTGCSTHNKEKTETTKYLVTNPVRKDTSIATEYVGQIKAIQHIELRALQSGYLEKIFVDEGQFIKKGQLMFQILPLQYQAEVQKAQAEVSFSEVEYNNTKSLADSNIVSPNELALAKAKLNKAKAELRLASVHLGFTQIKAPFDGIMDRFYARQGSLLEEGDLLTILSDNSKMWVYFNVPEAEYLNYKTRMNRDSMIHVQLRMANHEIFAYPGTVETVEADFNNETGNIAFRATFPNPDRLLRHGETGNVILYNTIRNALLIPQKATFEILDKKYVFVVDTKGIVHQKEIKIGATMEDLYVVSEGLSTTDRILVEGIRKVHNNDKIVVEYQKPETVMQHLKVYTE